MATQTQINNEMLHFLDNQYSLKPLGRHILWEMITELFKETILFFLNDSHSLTIFKHYFKTN